MKTTDRLSSALAILLLFASPLPSLCETVADSLSRVNYPVGRMPVGLAVGDLNGDGVADLVAATQETGTVAVLFGKRSGGFAASESSEPAL